MSSVREQYTLMYTGPRGRVSHLVHDNQRAQWGAGWFAICGIQNLPFGTGTWSERERAESLPLCKKCEREAPRGLIEELSRERDRDAHSE